MPREDWVKNTIPYMFEEWGAWPWGAAPRLGPAPKSVLDVGCGLSLKSQHVGVGDWTVRVGLDLHRPYLEAVETNVSWVPVCASVNQIHDLFLPKSFDLVLALDIIEHLEKDEALILLRDLEEVARVAVILETPDGFFPQDMDILGFDQHHLQTHRCGFEKAELEKLGYQVFARDYKLHPAKRLKDSDEIATECRLLNAVKRVDQ
jgi:SAM-dependent methyltransferase